MSQTFHNCNAINCIRNLPVKTQAPIGAFSIERTCSYSRDNSCRVRFDMSNNFTPLSVREAAPSKKTEEMCTCVKNTSNMSPLGGNDLQQK